MVESCSPITQETDYTGLTVCVCVCEREGEGGERERIILYYVTREN